MFAYRMTDPDPDESGPPCPLEKILGVILTILLLSTLILIFVRVLIGPDIKHKETICLESPVQQVTVTRCPHCYKEFTISERR